jgi:hypothetical protein
MSSNICFDLTVSYQYNLRGSRPQVEIIEDYEIEVSQQAFNQLRNNNNKNTQNNQNNLTFDSENIDKMEIDFFY